MVVEVAVGPNSRSWPAANSPSAFCEKIQSPNLNKIIVGVPASFITVVRRAEGEAVEGCNITGSGGSGGSAICIWYVEAPANIGNVDTTHRSAKAAVGELPEGEELLQEFE